MRRLLTGLALVGLGILGLGVGGGCSAQSVESAKSPQAAEAQAGAAPAADAAREDLAAPPRAPEATAVDDPAASLAAAEAELERALAQGAGPKKAEQGTSPGGVATRGDPCAIGCRALASMRRSADRLCELAGDSGPDTPRCDDARARVTRAESRMQGACPVCAEGG